MHHKRGLVKKEERKRNGLMVAEWKGSPHRVQLCPQNLRLSRGPRCPPRWAHKVSPGPRSCRICFQRGAVRPTLEGRVCRARGSRDGAGQTSRAVPVFESPGKTRDIFSCGRFSSGRAQPCLCPDVRHSTESPAAGIWFRLFSLIKDCVFFLKSRCSDLMGSKQTVPDTQV